MKPLHKGHVQVAFELRTKRTLIDWLTEHGPNMSRLAASKEIGYASPAALEDFVSRHMPADFKFRARKPLFSTEEVVDALAKRVNGESWGSIALNYKRDVTLLKDACRRYKKKLREGEQCQHLPVGWLGDTTYCELCGKKL